MVKMSIVEKNGNLSMQSLDRSIKINVAKSASLSAFFVVFSTHNFIDHIEMIDSHKNDC